MLQTLSGYKKIKLVWSPEQITGRIQFEHPELKNHLWINLPVHLQWKNRFDSTALLIWYSFCRFFGLFHSPPIMLNQRATHVIASAGEAIKKSNKLHFLY